MIGQLKKSLARLGFVAVVVCLASTESVDAALRHQWTFNDGTANDMVGGGNAHGVLSGNAKIVSGRLVLDGSANTVLELPAAALAINTYPAITVTMWAIPSSAMTSFHTLLGFGDVSTFDPNFAANYFAVQTHRGDNRSRAAISIGNDFAPFAAEDYANGPEINDNLQHHYAAVLTNSSISLYTDGILRQSSAVPVNGAANMISGIGTGFATVGRLYPVDPLFIGSVGNIRLYDDARTPLQILLEATEGVCDCTGPRLEIDRTTGAMTLTNGLAASNVLGYSITSVSGSLNPAAWKSIADNYDADSGTHSFDNDGRWTKLSAPGSKTDFSEFELDGGDGGKFGNAAFSTASLQIGSAGAWQKSIHEDLQIEIRLVDGSRLPVQVVYRGNGAIPFKRSDLNFDNQINLDDWSIFHANFGADVNGLTRAESYVFGDLNGDLILNRLDFRLFKADYIAAQGLGAFASMTGVPEPSSLLVLLTAVAVAVCLRSRRPIGI